MPPNSRGLLIIGFVRRYASTSIPSRPPPRPTPKSTRSRLTESPSQPTKSEGPHHDSAIPRMSFAHRITRFVSSPLRILLISPAIILAILHSPYEILTVNGQSMSPFLNTNSSDDLPTKDRVLVKRWGVSRSNEELKARKEAGTKEEFDTEFQRGQVVIFPTPHRPDKIAVKRIVALPGDMVQPLPGYTAGDGPVVIPWNHLWVEGDAGRRTESMDSNWYGPISQNLIIGEVRAVATSSWWNWSWLDWKQHTWPAREKTRVEENAIMEAAVDPDAVNYSSGWRNGSIALVLERMRSNPDQVLYSFVNDPKNRQETRRLYNNALYVADIASSRQEKELAKELIIEMEDVYGREALIFGISMKRRIRDRGELPNTGNSRIGEKVIKDESTTEAEKWLKKQGWALERNKDGTVKTHSSASQ